MIFFDKNLKFWHFFLQIRCKKWFFSKLEILKFFPLFFTFQIRCKKWFFSTKIGNFEIFSSFFFRYIFQCKKWFFWKILNFWKKIQLFCRYFFFGSNSGVKFEFLKFSEKTIFHFFSFFRIFCFDKVIGSFFGIFCIFLSMFWCQNLFGNDAKLI